MNESPDKTTALRQALAKLEEAYSLLDAAEIILGDVRDDGGAWDLVNPALRTIGYATEALKGRLDAE